APRHRVGCEDFSIGGNKLAGQVVQIDHMGVWLDRQAKWRRGETHFGELPPSHTRAESAWVGSVDPRRMPGGISAKMEGVVPGVEKIYTPLAGRHYEVGFLRDLVAVYGEVTRCPTFAHALPMGWTTKATPEPARVLGPHDGQMKPRPLRQTAERHARTEHALATWQHNFRRWKYRRVPSAPLLRAVVCENMPVQSIDLGKLKSALRGKRPASYWDGIKGRSMGVWSTPRVEEIVRERPRKTNSASCARPPGAARTLLEEQNIGREINRRTV